MSETREYRGLRFHTRSMKDGRVHFFVERISDGHILDSWPYAADSVEGVDQLMSQWIEDKIGTHPAPPVHCTACSSRLRPESRSDTDYQFENALWITFSGGYGMFIDPLEAGDPRLVICHACAHRLCAENPWIDDLLHPERSHSHRPDEGAELIREGHAGWDLEPARMDGGQELHTHLRDDHRVHDLPGESRDLWALHYSLHYEHRSDHRHRHD